MNRFHRPSARALAFSGSMPSRWCQRSPELSSASKVRHRRPDMPLDEGANPVTKMGLAVGEIEIHGGPALLVSAAVLPQSQAGEKSACHYRAALIRQVSEVNTKKARINPNSKIWNAACI